MVNPYSINSNYFKKIRKIFHQGLVHPWPYRIVRIALAALFIYGGVTKLFDPKAFAATISAYELLPEALLPLFAVGLPLIETMAGLALVLDRPWGLHLITGLLVLFVLVLGYGILGDLNVDCGCFGAEELDKQGGLRAAFYRDLVLIGVAAPYLYLSRRVREFSGSRKEK
ncbi:MAG: DoxX family protein [Deltaproteobacteria bacterium]|nr:DoxX family protein [Deltaproteobacteria bacterium]